VFGGPAWEQVGDRSYYHAYLREQPDLDWRNPDVREAMYDVLRFWLDRGVDGFRVDALRQLLKDPQLRDNPWNPDYVDGPEYDTLIPQHTTDLVAAMLLLTLRGTPTLYYGDELGMADGQVERYDFRDGCRTPMQWTPEGGFTTGEPWLAYGDRSVNAEDPNPMLELHKRLIALRRDFVEEDYRTLHAADGVLAYVRGDDHAVALNLTGEPRPLPVKGHIVLSTHRDGGDGALRADEGVVLRI
jgi:glycosidase